MRISQRAELGLLRAVEVVGVATAPVNLSRGAQVGTTTREPLRRARQLPGQIGPRRPLGKRRRHGVAGVAGLVGLEGESWVVMGVWWRLTLASALT